MCSSAKEKEKARLEKRAEAMQAAKEAFEAKVEEEQAAREEAGEAREAEEYLPKFDEDNFTVEFDDNNPPEEIPDAVPDDVDNDFNVEIKEAVAEDDE